VRTTDGRKHGNEHRQPSYCRAGVGHQRYGSVTTRQSLGHDATSYDCGCQQQRTQEFRKQCARQIHFAVLPDASRPIARSSAAEGISPRNADGNANRAFTRSSISTKAC
jgi:hypothetical protein